MEFKKFNNQILNFFKKYPRYFIVLGIFLVAILYGSFLPEVEEAKKNKNPLYRIIWNYERADLTSRNPSKIYQGVIQSKKGDFYRIGFSAKATENVSIAVNAVSKVGEKQEITTVELKDDEDNRYIESVFSTDGNYENIKIGRIKKDIEDEWSNAGIFISNLYITRLNIRNNFEAEKLKPTVYGETKMRRKYLKWKSQEDARDSLLMPDASVGQIFQAENDYLAFIEINASKVGSGGGGKYKLELREYDRDRKEVNEEVIKKASFSAKGLAKRLQKNGNYSFEFLAPLEKGKEYYIRINNKSVKTDKFNYLRLNKLKNPDADFDSYFLLTVVKFSETKDRDRILTGSRIEDLGERRMAYNYEASDSIFNFFDIFEYDGKLNFDWGNKILTNSSKKENYYTYKINTLYPFKKMRLIASQLGIKEGNIKIEYSYDNNFWKDISHTQNKNEPQEFDYVINDNSAGKTTIYFKVSYAGDKDKKKGAYGLKYFKVSALLYEN